jgi:hypothetical protein
MGCYEITPLALDTQTQHWEQAIKAVYAVPYFSKLPYV